MNTKSFLVCFIVVMLATSITMAGTQHGNFAPARGGFVRNGTGSFHGGHWNGGNWGGNWHHHHDHFNDFVFVGGFGFPFFGYPYGYGYYPYGYGYAPYGYGYGSGYYGYGSGYSGYGNGYYGNSYYGNGYNGNSYYGNGGVYRSSYYSGDRSNRSRSGVARLQRQLSRAGYYRGPIDGIMGSRTHYALRAYQHDHGTANIAHD